MRFVPTSRTVLAVFIVTLASCSNGGLKLHPVRGSVIFQDQPAEGATIVFHRVGGSTEAPMPSGVVKADGSYTLRTHPQGDGAPPGDYIVLITWYPPNAREQENPKNRLPDRYGSHSESPLRATVKEGPNELEPFRLTK